MGRLSGRVVIVTGGARGAGAATGDVLAAEGASVVLADVLDAEGEATAQRIGAAASYRHLDVTDEESWQRLVAETVARLGRIDILANVAAVLLVKEMAATTKAEFQRVIDVNMTGPFLGMQAVAPVMKRQKNGAIVNVSSIDGTRGTNSLIAYAGSKWGLRGVTKVAAMELGPYGIRVNTILPGGINTAMGNPSNQSEEELNRSFYRLQPIPRVAAPEEIGRVIAFLASDESSYIHGAEIAVDGGWSTGNYNVLLPGVPPEG